MGLRNVPPRYMYERVAKAEAALNELCEYARTGAESMRKLIVVIDSEADTKARVIKLAELDKERYLAKEAVYALMFVELVKIIGMLTEDTGDGVYGEEDRKNTEKR